MAPTPQAYYILSRAPYEVRGSIKKFGITKLLDSGVYKGAYPLHDVSPLFFCHLLFIDFFSIFLKHKQTTRWRPFRQKYHIGSKKTQKEIGERYLSRM